MGRDAAVDQLDLGLELLGVDFFQNALRVSAVSDRSASKWINTAV